MNNLESFRYQNVLNKCLEMCQEIEATCIQENTIDIDKLNELEKKLHKISKKEFKALSFDKFRKATKTLHSIKSHIDALSSHYIQSKKYYPDSQFETTKNRINSLTSDVLRINDKLTMSSIEKDKVPTREKIDIAFGIFSDFDLPDANGAIAGDLVQHLENTMPCIVTHSMISGASLERSQTRFGYLDQITPLLKNFEIFELITEQNRSSGLFVLLPKGAEDAQENSSLEKYDLNQSGCLKKASINRVLQYSKEEKPNVQDLRQIFSAETKKNKIFYLAGHGEKDAFIGGISKTEFPKMMAFFEAVACKGLLVESCYVGGTNAEAFTTLPKAAPYPVVLSSTGDFPTYGHLKTMQSRLTTLKELVENPLFPPTSKGFRNKYEFIQDQKQKDDYDMQSLMQVYIPGAKDIASGFRVIGEGRHLYPLTDMVVKQALLTRDNIQSTAEMIGLYPKIVALQIEASSTNTLHSMLSGDSLHLLKKLDQVPDVSALMSNTVKFSKQGLDRKAFCIGEVTDQSGNSIQEVVISCSFALCAYRKGEKYYCTTDGHDETEISPLKHALLCREVMIIEKKGPSSSSLFISNADPDLFYKKGSLSKEALATWGAFIDDFVNKKQDVSFDQVFKLLTDEHINQEDKDFIFCKLLLSKPQLALELMDKIPALAKAKDYYGRGIASYAIATGDLQVIDKLIEKGVNFFEKDKVGSSGIDAALSSGYWKIAKHLLSKEHPTLIPTQPWINAISKFMDMQPSDSNYADAKEVINTALKDGFKDLSCCSRVDDPKNMTSFLGVFAYRSNIEAVRLLLEAGYDPNALNCFCVAIQGGDEAVIHEMLKKGANPLLKDNQGYIPLIEAAACSSPQVFSQLIQSLKSASNATAEENEMEETSLGKTLSKIKDDNNTTPLLAALMSRNSAKIEMLLKAGAQSTNDDEVMPLFLRAVHTLIASDDHHNIELALRSLSDVGALDNLSDADLAYLLENGYFKSRLESMRASSPLFVKLIRSIINRADLDQLNSLKEKISFMNLNRLEYSQKLYLVTEGLIDAIKAGIVPEAMKNANESVAGEEDEEIVGVSDDDVIVDETDDEEPVGNPDTDSGSDLASDSTDKENN